MAKKKPTKEPEPEPEPEAAPEPEEVLAPAEYRPPMPSVEIMHPAVLGYKKGETGKMLWDPTLISPVCLGSIWEPAQPWVCLDSRVQHPASFMHHEDLTPGQAMDPTQIDMAMISPIFAGVALAKNKQTKARLSQRPQQPLVSASDQGKYLDDNVWPTLELALEKLQGALKYHIPVDVLDAYNGGRGGHDVQRVTHPGHAEEFDPLVWLSRYLGWYNPNTPSKYTRETAAIFIQRVFRGFLGRKEARAIRKARHVKRLAEERLALENKSATIIQAAYRGHSVRLFLRLGRTEDLVLGKALAT